MRTPGQRARPRRRLLVAACAYVVLGVVVQRPLVRAGLGDHVYHQNMLGQDCLLHAWTIAWDQHALATAPCSLPDANIFHPERGTLFYSDHLLGLALVTAPLRLLTDDALLVHNLLLLAAMAAALVGGLVYGFAPMRFAADGCQIQMTAAWWMPLVIYAGQRAVRGDGRRWGAAAGLALLGQGLTGIYVTAFFAPFLALAHVWWWRRHPPARAAGGWAALLAGELAAVLLLMPTAFAYRGVQEHLGTARSPFLNAILSLQWSMLPAPVPVIGLSVLLAATLVRPFDLPRRLHEERGLFFGIAVGALLLALGPAASLPNDLGTVPGPYRLLVALPGFTALRVPARMLHVALLGASVLAAGGVAVLRQVAWRAPAAVTLAAAVALVLEQPPVAPGVIRIPHPAQLDRVYRWLATEPLAGAIVELPMDPARLGTAVRQYASTAHWQRMLNGVSGIEPTMYPYVARRLADFPAADVVDDLATLGVRHAIVHTRALSPATRAALDEAERARRVIKRRWAHGDTIAYALRPAARPGAVARDGHRGPRARPARHRRRSGERLAELGRARGDGPTRRLRPRPDPRALAAVHRTCAGCAHDRPRTAGDGLRDPSPPRRIRPHAVARARARDVARCDGVDAPPGARVSGRERARHASAGGPDGGGARRADADAVRASDGRRLRQRGPGRRDVHALTLRGPRGARRTRCDR